MKKTIKGSFEISSTPQTPDETTEKIGAMRMTFEKKFSGSLEATGLVSMMGMMNKELASGAYVALELVTGTLEGRAGTFCFQHNSKMARGLPEQSITVVPDSGHGELKGLTGEMTIDIVDGKHFYVFDFEMPEV